MLAGWGVGTACLSPYRIAPTQRPITHQFRSREPGGRSFTGWGRRRIAALLHALEKAIAPGARPSPAASTR
ncbi:MAG: hypothetical protein GX456_13615 [Verrucomicrobia bacterium]|nr:hypothetical protein [Verrucomicrobiota bacterium]